MSSADRDQHPAWARSCSGIGTRDAAKADPISSDLGRMKRHSDDAPDDSNTARRMAERLQNQNEIGAKPTPGRREPSFLRRLSRQ